VSPPPRLGTLRTVVWSVVAVGLWFLLRDVPGAVRLWTVTLCVLLPILAVVQVGAIGDPDALPRIPAYVSSILSLWLIAALTAAVARIGHIDAAQLRLAPVAWGPLLAWSLAATVAGLALLLAANRLGVRESALLLRLLPVSRAEKQTFAGLSVTAGFCEELVFRGFLLHVLAGSLGTLGAIAAASAVFGLAHAYQEVTGAARAGILGALLAVPVVLSGSLWPSMIAHTAIDIASGIFLKDRLTGTMA
jgi:membrane protease YdiL (CAAX protease family)